MQDMLLVLNYDKRYASQLAMKLRAERFDCRIMPGDTPLETITQLAPMGLVLAGGVSGEVPLSLDGKLLAAGIPVLAMGDTSLALCTLLRGCLEDTQAVHVVQTVHFLPSRVTEGLGESERFLSALRPMRLNEELLPLALCQEQVIGFKHTALPLYGFAFQLEQNDPDGMTILMRFAQDICGCTQRLTDSAFISAAKAQIQQAVGEGKALCVMTGGLDSGVAALLAHRAIGDRLQCFFIDTGLLRENEADDFLYYYQRTLGLNIRLVSAQDKFYEAIEGITQAEQKAAVVARVYLDVLRQEAGTFDFSAVIRGTSANDVLRTGDEYITPVIPTDKVIVEPLRELFKEEIRRIGEALGMPADIHQAQPFPGTGLALRVMGAVTRSRLAILRKADAIFCDEVKQAGLGKRLWKYFAVLYHLSYEADENALAVSLRAVTIGSVGGEMRALPARLPYDLLERYTGRVMQAFPEVVKVVTDITPGSSYSQVEWR
jgi:GMP synthase (glutamine-hydrolysing)